MGEKKSAASLNRRTELPLQASSGQALLILSLLCVQRKKTARTHAADAHRCTLLQLGATAASHATMSGWAAKQAKKAEWAEARKLDKFGRKGKEALPCCEVPVMAILKRFREMAGTRGRNAHRPAPLPKYGYNRG